MDRGTVELLIVGGGINGTGIACEASARGLSVILCEQNDLSSGTSSSSTKLIHGGLRYLEHFAFRLVRESLQEREILLKKAPHLVTPMTFYIPDNPTLRSPWLVRAGLFLYDTLARRRSLPGSARVHFARDSSINPLNLRFRGGFSYADCMVDDARLVITNALAAHDSGAQILPYTACVEARRHEDHWIVTLKEKATGNISTVRAKALINTTGPWITSFLNEQLQLHSAHRVRLVKGSHIITPRLYPGDQAYLLQNKDGRVVFVIPYQQYFSMIGTTDIPYAGDPAKVCIEPDEVHYLCHVVSDYFHKRLKPRDIVGAWSGVRPLLDDNTQNPSRVSREYCLEYQAEAGQAPLVSVFGGKLTTYRALACQAVDKLRPHFPFMGACPPPTVPLPGGDIPEEGIRAFAERFVEQYPWLPPQVAQRYVYAYGTRALSLMVGIEDLGDMGEHFGHGLFAREIAFLRENEWACTLDDILWRRTKLGFLFSKQEQQSLEKRLKETQMA